MKRHNKKDKPVEITKSNMEISKESIDYQDNDNNNFDYNGVGVKRRRMVVNSSSFNTMLADKIVTNEVSSSFLPKESRNFLHLECNSGVYQTDSLKQSRDGDTLYLPLNGYLFVNMQNADEITFDKGIFFIANESGRYSSSTEGTAMNIWRFCESKQQMTVSRSLLITQPVVFERIKGYLLGL